MVAESPSSTIVRDTEMTRRLKLKKMALTAVFVMAASCAFAATPSKNDVLQAIAVMEKHVSGPEAAEAAKTIVIYAQVSDDVLVDIGPEQLPWVEESFGLERDKEMACKSMLMAAFVAGDIKSQIKNDRVEDDTYSGWIFAISTYNRLREKEHFRSASIDSLIKMKDDGTLLQHAREVKQAEEQEDPSDEQRKPMALIAVPGQPRA
jgi:hypothetical protein